MQCESILYYFSMLVSSLWTTPFKLSVVMECRIELSEEKSEIHPILDETAAYENHKLFLISGRPSCSLKPWKLELVFLLKRVAWESKSTCLKGT